MYFSLVRMLSIVRLYHFFCPPGAGISCSISMQQGDVPVTYADSETLERDYGFTPKITIREGLRAFAEWYKEFYC